MIYTVGYQKLTMPRLEWLMARLKIDVLIDVRSEPRSRRPEFNIGRLAQALGARYEWRPSLGGFQQIDPTALDALENEPRHVMLMCMEEAPGECHRHFAIAAQLLHRCQVIHVFRDELVDAQELQRSIEVEDEYEILEMLPAEDAAVAAEPPAADAPKV